MDGITSFDVFLVAVCIGITIFTVLVAFFFYCGKTGVVSWIFFSDLIFGVTGTILGLLQILAGLFWEVKGVIFYGFVCLIMGLGLISTYLIVLSREKRFRQEVTDGEK